ncbi:amino acid deaminase [Arthrobacter sp. M4]|uniref:amino acid deaminase n=1 Tax=Arthrobacter sp. M4 TaxID=218160 RepID=UPI001CDC96CF|nr:amino acid deaminase [Arthrobacter sp. M4]MCA4133462.1 amino acid deaminase [Arthrobacter sp. M4]
MTPSTTGGLAAIEASALAGLGKEALGWNHKAAPVAAYGTSTRDFAEARHALAELQTPLLTLDAVAMAHNLDTMAAWCAQHGVLLAPHGKTTMAPQLWAEQLNRGAWGITLANFAQLRVARKFGVQKLMLANSLTDPHAIEWVAGEVASGATILSWVDSTDTVHRLERVLAATNSAGLDVLVELGGTGGRTGARSVSAALEVARSVAASPSLRLVGVSGYEGSLAHTAEAGSIAKVRAYLEDMKELHESLLAEALYDSGDVIITAGGSAYFDDVVEVLSPCMTGNGAPRVNLVIRSGAYVAHDDGFYRGISPFSREQFLRGGGQPFRTAMHGWARVVSQPEPGLAILDAGKRDLPVDEGLPIPRAIGSELGTAMEPLEGATITAVNDQHCFLSFDPKTTTVKIGDVVRLGLSHPCTAFDKWTLIPVLADTDNDPTVVDLIRTFF